MYNLQNLKDLSEDLSSLQPRVSAVLIEAYSSISHLEKQIKDLRDILARSDLDCIHCGYTKDNINQCDDGRNCQRIQDYDMKNIVSPATVLDTSI